ncbi:hypothetical protein [Streptomyces griseosporeus]
MDGGGAGRHTALRFAGALHRARHFALWALLFVPLMVADRAVGWWLFTFVYLLLYTCYVLPVLWWTCCRRVSDDVRRARRVLDHYAWQSWLMDRQESEDRSGGWEGTFVRLRDPAGGGSPRVLGIPGPGRRRPRRGLRDPRVVRAALDGGDGARVWFAGDARFGGVLSVPGAGGPVLLRARARRGLRGEGRAGTPERDARAIRAGLLDFRDLPKRHPLRQAYDAERAVAVMRRQDTPRRPGPAPTGAASLLERSAPARILVRAALGLTGAALGACGATVLVVAVLPGSGGPAVRLVVGAAGLLVLAPAWPCLAGARYAGARREPTGAARAAARLTLRACAGLVALAAATQAFLTFLEPLL